MAKPLLDTRQGGDQRHVAKRKHAASLESAKKELVSPVIQAKYGSYGHPRACLGITLSDGVRHDGLRREAVPERGHEPQVHPERDHGLGGVDE